MGVNESKLLTYKVKKPLYPPTYKVMYNLNTRFRTNKSGAASDCTIEFPQINNVISMRLESITLIHSWFKIANDTQINQMNIDVDYDEELQTSNLDMMDDDDSDDDDCKNHMKNTIKLDISSPWFKITDDNRTFRIITKETTESDDTFIDIMMKTDDISKYYSASMNLNEIETNTFITSVRNIIDNIQNKYTSNEDVNTKITDIENSIENNTDIHIIATKVDELLDIIVKVRTEIMKTEKKVKTRVHYVSIDKGNYTKETILQHIGKKVRCIQDSTLPYITFDVDSDHNLIGIYTSNIPSTITIDVENIHLNPIEGRKIIIETKRESGSYVTHTIDVKDGLTLKEFELDLNISNLYLSNTTSDLRYIQAISSNETKYTMFQFIPCTPNDLSIDVKVVVTDNTFTIPITFGNGNYDINQISNIVNSNLSNYPYINFKVNEFDLRSSFTLTPTPNIKQIRIQLWDKELETINFDKVKQTFGYIQGFRENEYILTNDNPIAISESIFNVSSENYVYFVVNDHQVGGRMHTNYAILDNKDAPQPNILAKINLYEGVNSVNIQETNSLQLSKQRYYTNPVNIDRISIKLINEDCQQIDLNGVDFSFTLEFEVKMDNAASSQTYTGLQLVR